MAKNMNSKELIYNVYFEEFNSREIVAYNIFSHGYFYESLIKINKKYNKDFEKFSEEVKKSLMYYFWSKSEYEIILTSWPPYVDSNEIDRLVMEKNEHIKKYGNFYREDVRLIVGLKVDIYDQIMLNWDIFIKYLWDNKESIKLIR